MYHINKPRRTRSSPKDRWATRAPVDFLFYRSPAVHPAATEFIGRISDATRRVSAAVSRLHWPPSCLADCGNRCTHGIERQGSVHLKKCPLVHQGPFVAAVYVFHCCGHHGGLMNGGPVFGRTLGAPHSPRNSPHVWGALQRPRFHRLCHALRNGCACAPART